MNEWPSLSSVFGGVRVRNDPERSRRGLARLDLSPELIRLSDREVEVLTWAARGKTSADIALILGVSKRTVDFHIDNARAKLGVATRIEAAVKAAVGRLIEP